MTFPFSLQYVQHVRTLSSVMIVARAGPSEVPPDFGRSVNSISSGGHRGIILCPPDFQSFLRPCRATSNVVKKAKHSYVSQRKKLLSLTATNFSTGFIKFTNSFQKKFKIKIFANLEKFVLFNKGCKPC